MPACEFLLQVSIWDLVREVGKSFMPNPALSRVLSELGVSANLVQLCDKYIDETLIGEGEVHIYRSKYSNNKVIFDLFRDPLDQLDLILIGVFCTNDRQALVAKLLFEFFTECGKQIYFSMSVGNAALRELAEPSNYPRTRSENGYRQKLFGD